MEKKNKLIGICKRGKSRFKNKHHILSAKYGRHLLKELNLKKYNLKSIDVLNIIRDSNMVIKDILLDNIEGFKLPERLGFMVISSQENNKKRIDYKRSKEFNAIVYHKNSHGPNALVFWENYNITGSEKIPNYKFILDHDFRKKKSRKLLEGKVYSTYEKNYFYNMRFKISKNANRQIFF